VLLNGLAAKRLRLHSTRRWRQGRIVHISAVERAGLSSLNEGQKISFEITADRKSGKSSADNLRV
jgi:hypothetical protein